eukprot:365573-Chlamydomonas_euryale.AAC.14
MLPKQSLQRFNHMLNVKPRKLAGIRCTKGAYSHFAQVDSARLAISLDVQLCLLVEAPAWCAVALVAGSCACELRRPSSLLSSAS